MYKAMRSDKTDFSPGKSTRSHSISSEVPSLPGHPMLSPPPSINPEPQYIAVSAASQLVSAELEIDGVTISPSALAQLNSFLDHILFNILLTAKSTKLSLLRPAIYNVLKPKLGKSAISGADEELREYLEDDEDDDQGVGNSLGQEVKREFDLELAWKLARLRCMVYSRLGDLEEDDEDEYIERENLDERGGRPRRFSSHPSRVTTASAIFLTSVIEFLAEHALAYAAQATQRRSSKSRTGQASPDPTASLFFPPERIVVSEADMRQLGRDSPLQKLWRNWRHQIRLPTDPASRPISPESLMVLGHSRRASSDDVPESEMQHQLSVAEILHETDPARIPLPMVENDVEEIENREQSTALGGQIMIPATESSNNRRPRRPRSLELFPRAINPPTPTSIGAKTTSPESTARRPPARHKRSNSLPLSPELTPRAPQSNIAFTEDHPVPASESRYEPFAQAKEVNREEVNRASSVYSRPQSAMTLSGFSRDENAPETMSTTMASMPGTYPTQATLEPGVLDPGQDTERKVEDFSAEPYVFPIESTSGQEVTESSLARSSHEAAALDPILPARTHPPRTSSKVTSEYTPRSQPRPSPIIGNFPPMSKFAPGYTGIPPLAPLQENVGASRDAPAESFAIEPTTEARSFPQAYNAGFDYRDMKRQSSSKSSHHTQSSSSSSKLLGFDREQQSAMQLGSERAGVKRVYPAEGAQDANGHASRPNTSHSMKDMRPGTANSHVSSLKQGIVGRVSMDTNGRGRKASIDQDEKKQSLDNLIRSEETLKYTLTPQNMREMEVSSWRPSAEVHSTDACYSPEIRFTPT
jgi:hypothetical protein